MSDGDEKTFATVEEFDSELTELYRMAKGDNKYRESLEVLRTIGERKGYLKKDSQAPQQGIFILGGPANLQPRIDQAFRRLLEAAEAPDPAALLGGDSGTRQD